MITPAGTVALRMLDALGVSTVDQARDILALWCRPSPALSVADVRQILAIISARASGVVYTSDMPPVDVPMDDGVDEP
ncbi:MAG TPA: hypothetical protein VF202_01110 [Trueperaceae bacterium]